MRIAGWSDRAGMQTIDQATRWPLYLGLAAEPLVALLVILGEPEMSPAAAGGLSLLTLSHAAVCLVLLHRGIGHYLGGRSPSSRLTALAVCLTMGGLAATLALLPSVELSGGQPSKLGAPAGLVACSLCAVLTGALAPLIPTRPLILFVALPAGVALLAQTALDGQPRYVWALNYVFCVGFIAVTYRASIWLLGVVAKMASAQEVQ